MNEGNGPLITRREALKKIATFLGGASLAACTPTNPDSQPTMVPTISIPDVNQTVPEQPQPEVRKSLLENPSVHCGIELHPQLGIELFGTQEGRIDSQEKLLEVCEFNNQRFDQAYKEKLGIPPEGEVWQQKEKMLDENSRFLEIMVNRSVYDRYLQGEQGFDFVELMQMHVDVLNRAMAGGRPPAPVEMKLKRVVVVDDALMPNVKGSYFDYRPKDIDGNWPIAAVNETGGYCWSFKAIDGELQATYPAIAEENQVSKRYRYGNGFGEDLLQQMVVNQGKTMRLDCGLTHEWLHEVFNLPDEYQADMKDLSDGHFKGYVGVTGSGEEPWMSPYLTALVNYNKINRIRSSHGHPLGIYRYSEIGYWAADPLAILPKEDVTLHFTEGGQPIAGEVQTFSQQYTIADYYKHKHFSNLAEYVGVNEGKITMDMMAPQSVQGRDLYRTGWKIKVQSPNEVAREVYLPVHALSFARLMTGKDDLHFTIHFTGQKLSTNRMQLFQWCESEDLPRLNQRIIELGGEPYASMGIEGSSSNLVWINIPEGLVPNFIFGLGGREVIAP